MSFEPGISIPTRERCGVCHRVSPIGFWVPNDVWLRAVPDYFRETVLCLGCFTSFADERMLAWERQMQFYPVSLRSHLEGVIEPASPTATEIEMGDDRMIHGCPNCAPGLACGCRAAAPSGPPAPAASPRECLWSLMDDDSTDYETACGHAWQFMDGGPTENGMRFCPYCGAHLVTRDEPTPAASSGAAPQIDCPACGVTVQQMASATLGLALWQHWNWACPKRAASPRRCPSCGSANQERIVAVWLCNDCGHEWDDAPPERLTPAATEPEHKPVDLMDALRRALPKE